MSWQLDRLPGTGLTDATLEGLLDRLLHAQRPRYRRLWTYYRNPMRPRAVASEDRGADRPYRQGQEWGLPSRITGARMPADIDAAPGAVPQVARKEVVIENDIAWRIDTMVDYLFGRPLRLESTAPDPARRALLTAVLRRILAHHGGPLLLQQLALLGSVHGFVDVLVKLDPSAASTSAASAARSAGESAGPAPAAPSPAGSDDSVPDAGAPSTAPEAFLDRLARAIRLEIVEPARAVPVLCPADNRALLAYVQCYDIPAPQGPSRPALRPNGGWLDRLLGRWRSAGIGAAGAADRVCVVELITPTAWQRYHDRQLVAAGVNSLGAIPLVHIQNVPLPFEYAGAGDVEPLIPLQDELNTRLSDRANRITLQSFKMYLGKGIDGFLNQPVAPGRMWMTDNDRADVIEFGGDAHAPSEEAHIADLREALDKTSGVTPIAAGAIKNRIGRLSSAAALRITLLALLSKTDKKRTTYGAALERLCALALAWLDRAGLLATAEDERGVELHWTSPLPENDLEKLEEAAAKLRVGVPNEIVLRELGYGSEAAPNRETAI